MSKIIAGSSSKLLAINIAKELGWPLLDCNINRFDDGEISISIDDNLAGQDVYIIQSTSRPVNDNLVELLLIADGVRRAGALSITAVMAYFGYGRADRQVVRNGAVAADCVAAMLKAANIDRVVSVDLHSASTEGFFKMPLYNISTAKIIASLIGVQDCVIISPDVGGKARAMRVAAILAIPIPELISTSPGFTISGAHVAGSTLTPLDDRSPSGQSNSGNGMRPCLTIKKERDVSGKCTAKSIDGDVKGKICCIIDDIIDSGDTLCKAAELLIANGATEVVAYATHGILSGDACARIDASPLKSLYISDSIACDFLSDKVRVFSVAEILAKQIQAMS